MIDFLLECTESLFECAEDIFYSKVRKSDAMKMLDRYILAMADFLNAERIEDVLCSEPVENYAKRLNLSWYLHYLKKHPKEVFRE